MTRTELGAEAGSEEEGFLLQLIALPEGQLAELLGGHLEDPQEILGGEVPLRGERKVMGCWVPPRLRGPSDPSSAPTSSLVLSTPGGSFTRPRFVTISIS